MNLIVQRPFEEVLAKVKANIIANGFLLIHEINTKEILRKNGYDIADLRQLLFFHPIFMNEILEKDIDSVIKVPLKIVVRAEHSHTVLTYTPAAVLFENISSLSELGVTLDGKIRKILQLV